MRRFFGYRGDTRKSSIAVRKHEPMTHPKLMIAGSSDNVLTKRVLNMTFLAIVLLPIIAFLQPVPTNAQSPDDWDERFSFALLDRYVYAAVSDGAEGFYVGGEFESTGSFTAHGIAHWDGTQWQPVGDGLEEGASVYALATGPDGALYVGGEFVTTGGGLTVNNVAKWDGVTWTALGSGLIDTGFDATIEALTVDASGNVYAGGFFDRGSGVRTDRIAMWDGTSWQPLGDGFDGDVLSIAIASDGTVYAGGDFDETSTTEIEMEGVASWDGTVWTEVGGGTSRAVEVIQFDGQGNLYASGCFTDIGGTTASGIAVWDGSTWSTVGTGLQRENFCPYAKDLAIASDGSLLAGGIFDHAGGVPAANIAQWDGTSWSAVDVGTSGDVEALAIGSGGAIFLGGVFIEAGGEVVNYAAEWDGSTWSRLGSVQHGMNQSVTALAPDGAGGVYAGGGFSAAGANPVNLIAHWTGERWEDLGDGLGQFTSVSALAADGAGGLYAGGSFITTAGAPADRLAYWDGASWSGVGQAPDDAIAALALANDGTLYAGGRIDEIGGVATGLGRWDGTAWTSIADVNSTVTALAVADDGSLYAGGGIRDNGSVYRVAQWDGTSWTEIASPLNSTSQPEVLAVGPDGMLYAGGRFTQIGGVDANNLARWDGTTWSEVGGGVSGTTGLSATNVFGITFDAGGNLYVAGSFADAGSVPANNIARWDGSAWTTLGDGLEGSARALVYAGGADIWVGGFLSTAGGIPSVNIARWQGADPVGVEADERAADDALTGLLAVYPNPTATEASVEFTLATPTTSAVVEAFDVLGRRVARLYDGALGSGTHTLSFDTTPHPPGFYVVRLETPEGVHTRMLTVVR
jgi:hypothetical protein